MQNKQYLTVMHSVSVRKKIPYIKKIIIIYMYKYILQEHNTQYRTHSIVLIKVLNKMCCKESGSSHLTQQYCVLIKSEIKCVMEEVGGHT